MVQAAHLRYRHDRPDFWPLDRGVLKTGNSVAVSNMEAVLVGAGDIYEHSECIVADSYMTPRSCTSRRSG
jgi:hypothetical protein